MTAPRTRNRSCLLSAATLLLATLAATTQSQASPATPAQVMVCTDSPAIASGSSYSTCKKPGYGPKYNTDLVRSNDPKNAGGQDWEPWATLTSARQVCQLQSDGSCAWTTKAAVQASINPPAPPSTTTPPVSSAYTATVTLTWSNPTANTDGTPLTDLASLDVYQVNGSALASLGVCKPPAATFTTNPLPPGTYTFAVSALNAAGAESDKAQITTTIVAPPPPPKKPSPVSSLKAVVNTSIPTTT